jgi:hypothetical protein
MKCIFGCSGMRFFASNTHFAVTKRLVNPSILGLRFCSGADRRGNFGVFNHTFSVTYGYHYCDRRFHCFPAVNAPF